MILRNCRSLSLAAGLAVILVVMGASPPPARAAMTTLYVDNNAPLCKPTAYSTIQAAVDATTGPARIIVCPGTYAEAILVKNKTNLKIMAKRHVTLTPTEDPFDYHLVEVRNSTNVTIQGFTIDGLGQVGALIVGRAAIRYYETSGAILKNTIVNWRTSGYPSGRSAIGIVVDGSAGQAVRIERNKIPELDMHGIYVSGPVVVKIRNNTMTLVLPATLQFAYLLGVSLSNQTSGEVSGNKIAGDIYPPSDYHAAGIEVVNCGGVTVSRNRISRIVYGVRLITANTATANVTIRNNTLLDVMYGVHVSSTGSTANTSLTGLVIKGNRVTNRLAAGLTGIDVNAGATTYTATITGAVVTRNRIKNFGTGVDHIPGIGGTISGVFDPNTVR